jgi:hypothetical protein
MGKVLSEDFVDVSHVKGVAKKRRCMPTLKLTHFNEMDPTFMNLRSLESICPNIRNISLSMPVSVYHDGDDNNDKVAVDILKSKHQSQRRFC